MNRTLKQSGETDNFRTIGELVDDIVRGLTIVPTAQIIKFPIARRSDEYGNGQTLPDGSTI